MAKLNNDMTLAPSAGEGWDAWGAACGFTSWASAASSIGITTAQMVTIRKSAPRKTIRLAMDAVLAQRAHADQGPCERTPETSRRQSAVELLLSMGYQWNDGAWVEPKRGEAVAWQYRFNDGSGDVCQWLVCESDEAERFREHPKFDLRPLYTDPPRAQEAQPTDRNDRIVGDDEIRAAVVDFMRDTQSLPLLECAELLCRRLKALSAQRGEAE